MKKTKIILITLMLIGSFFGITSQVKAEILFEDNFDNSPDWQSQQTINKSAGGYDISWSMTRADKCTTHCPPKGWTSYRTASSLWTDDRGLDTYILDSTGARGGVGKGITYNVEMAGTDDSDHFGGWAGGDLMVSLGDTGSDTLFVRAYFKWGDNWTWMNPATNPTHALYKQIVISSYNCSIFNDSCINFQGEICNPIARFPSSGGCAYPLSTLQQYHNINYEPIDKSTPLFSIRRAPNYDASDGPDSYSSITLPRDSEWHSYEYGVKMNSSPGVADGEYSLYIDGIKVLERTDIIWQMSGTGSRDDSYGWNLVSILDNVNNSACEIVDRCEKQIYMDDIVISTEYIGPDYIIGQNINPRADTNQDNQITSTDAMLTLRKSLNLDMSQTNWQDSSTTGDVNCDNTTNSTDAMLILRKSLGLDMTETGWCVE